jgi:ABC-type oligopeptide transport system ATPase subunit
MGEAIKSNNKGASYMRPVLQVRNLEKVCYGKGVVVKALNGISFDVYQAVII